MISGIAAFWLVYGKAKSSGDIGFTLVLITSFNSTLLQAVGMFNDMEVQANRHVRFCLGRSILSHSKKQNSLERLRDYLMIDKEPKPSKAGEPVAYWPASGTLQVENLSARYSVNGPEVLRDVSFHIKSGERVAVGMLMQIATN